MTYVMSDIHGNKTRFDSVMKQINLQPDDTLYVLGDVIDRYAEGIQILRQLMKMPNVKMLLGNHEYMMLNALDVSYDPKDFKELSDHEDALHLWYRNGGGVTHNYLKHIRKDIRAEVFSYLRSLPLNIDIEVCGQKYKLIHGAPVDRFSYFSYCYDSIEEYAVWKRWMPFYPGPEEGVILIFGHTPTERFQHMNPLEIWYAPSKQLIGIDCGCGYPSISEQFRHHSRDGRLACLRLEDMKEFYSEIEHFPREVNK